MIRWERREPPLAAAAVLAQGEAAGRLRERAGECLDQGQELRACSGEGWLLLLGEPEELPWADGATYLGAAGGLLLPTTSRPSAPEELLRRQVELELGLSEADLVALLPGVLLSSPRPVRPASRESLG